MDLESQQSIQGETSQIQTCYNAIWAFLGFGMLSLPYAISQGGWFSLWFLLPIAGMAFYTSILIKRCMQTYALAKSYEDIAGHAFGWKGKVVAAIVANMELYMIAIALLIMEGDCLHNMFPDFHLKLFRLMIKGKQLFILITTLAIFPTLLFSNMRIVSYISFIGLLASIIIPISLICIGSTISMSVFHEQGRLLSIEGIPTTISLILACFGGHPVVPTAYVSMKSKNHFTKVMIISFVFNTVMYITVAVIGYLMYGEEVSSIITTNLPSKSISSKVAIFSSLIIPISKYALIITPVANAVANAIGNELLHNNNKGIISLIRVLLLMSTGIVACFFPYFEFMMALVGSLAIVVVSFLLPSCCYLKIYGARNIRNFELLIIIGIILFGTSAGIIGTYSSITKLVHHL